MIQLSFNETELDEITVNSFPSENKFKELILDSPYIPNQLENNLTNNVSFINNIYRLGNHHTANSIDNVVKRFASGNGEATFLSSNPSMGVIGLIRSMKRKNAIPMEISSTPKYQLDFNKLRKTSNDSTKRYSDYFRG